MVVLNDSDRRQMDAIAAGLPSKSEQIRQLADAGFARADIARYLGIRYQHVRNVLTAPRPKRSAGGAVPSGGPPAAPPPAPDAPAAESKDRPWLWTTVGRGGRIELPPAFLEAIGVGEGDPIQLAVEGGTLRVLSKDAVVREVQGFVRRYVPDEAGLVEELIEERRAEARREAAEGNAAERSD